MNTDLIFEKKFRTNGQEFYSVKDACPNKQAIMDIIHYAHGDSQILPCDEIYNACFHLFTCIEQYSDIEKIDDRLQLAVDNWNESLTYHEIWKISSVLKDELVNYAEEIGIEIDRTLELSALLQSYLYWYGYCIAQQILRLETEIEDKELAFVNP